MEYFNTLQSSIESLQLDKQPQEIQDQFYDIIYNIPFVRSLIDVNRPYAKDLPKDEEGKIIVDITKPHILEDVDYFRPTALTYQKYKKLTLLRPNANPNSEYGKWVREEIRRCYEGYIRQSDGEWITGDMYFFLNYCPILLSKIVQGKQAIRVWDFPEFWEGHYYKFHYLDQARKNGHHAAELARRSAGKSFTAAAMIAKRFILGETKETNREVKCLSTAYQKEYLVKDGLLNKFQSYIDFCAENTQFPHKRLKSSLQDMAWKMGYIDLDTGTQKGTLNEVIGVSSKDDSSKLRGKRGSLIVIEEFGAFPNLLSLYNVLRPSVEEGDVVYGQIICQGTASEESSDFASAQEIMYNPLGYNMQDVPNIYDKAGQSKAKFVYFFPGYLNRKGCYDSNGNSDVTKALLEILINRYKVKYNSTDLNSISQAIAEIPITPQEAILRTKGNLFPIVDINERINQLDNNPSEYDDVYIGTLVQNTQGEIDFKPTGDTPIRDFPTKDNKVPGALEIFKMPEKSGSGKIPYDRYILSLDPVDSDSADTMSLSSIFVLDLWTDKIVAEYTGRTEFADDSFELLRKLCIFYNGKCLYENNLKGCYSYFSKMKCTHLLADTPEYLKDKDLIKSFGIANQSKGVHATAPINNYANTLIRDWLTMPVVFIEKDENGEEIEVSKRNLYTIRNRALLKELSLYNPEINVDRIRSLGMLMLYREEKMILYNGDIKSGASQKVDINYLGNDPFFKNNYDDKFLNI